MITLRDNILRFAAVGDGRVAANIGGQASQLAGERVFVQFMQNRYGIGLERLHAEEDHDYGGHGLIQTIEQANRAFSKLEPYDPVVLFYTQWAFGDRLQKLFSHKGPILLASNFDPGDPGLVGLLAARATLAKNSWNPDQAGYSMVWSSDDFRDAELQARVDQFMQTGKIDDTTLIGHAKRFDPAEYMQENGAAINLGLRVGAGLEKDNDNLVVYNPQCMGMLHAYWNEFEMKNTGVQLTRRQQVELLHDMQNVPEDRARSHIEWLVNHGLTLDAGITDKMKVDIGRMYDQITRDVARAKAFMATIAFQTSMNSSWASSDGAEFMGESIARPPVYIDGEEFRPGMPVGIGNEADIPMALSRIYHMRAYQAASTDPEFGKLVGLESQRKLQDPRWWVTAAHDVRWGRESSAEAYFTNGQKIQGFNAFVWAFNLSGPMPVEHTAAAWANPEKPWSDCIGRVQDLKFFENGGITNEALARAGEIVWSRAYMIDGKKYLDIGRGATVNLEEDETKAFWGKVTRTWPLNEAILYGVSRDQFMAKHHSNHISLSYAPDAKTANAIMFTIAAAAHRLGYEVNICGDHKITDSIEYKVANGQPVYGPMTRAA